MKLKSILFFSMLLSSAIAFSQNTQETKTKKSVEVGFEGMLGISYGSETLGINVGGPSLKFKINKLKVGVGCFPSLIINDDKAFPRLAVSPIIEYQNIMLITPYYGYDAKNRQIWTFGAGYKFF